jgi:two-component system CheB/CheR fusion protein
MVAQASREPRRVLVVDDCPDTRLALRLLLRQQGHEVCEAGDGPEALKLAPGFAPDVVLLDLGLPGLDGFETARQLRQLPGLGQALLVAVTGHGRLDEVARCFRSGFDLHLLKPYEWNVLGKLLGSRVPAPTQ